MEEFRQENIIFNTENHFFIDKNNKKYKLREYDASPLISKLAKEKKTTVITECGAQPTPTQISDVKQM